MNDYTDFGFKEVPRLDKLGLVRDLFSSVAGKYDLMNDIMSFGLHRCWKKRFIHKIALKHDCMIVDVAAGTGDISIQLHKTFPYLNLTTHLVDLTPSMLEGAKQKAIDNGIVKGMQFYVSAGESLPLDDESMDVYTISFGLRNVSDRSACLQEAYRVLKPGGYFYCLEFSQVNNPVLRKLYDMYSFHGLPFFGEHIAKDKDAYLYLAESIRRFPAADVLCDELRAVGFENVAHEKWLDGIIAIHSCQKLVK